MASQPKVLIAHTPNALDGAFRQHGWLVEGAHLASEVLEKCNERSVDVCVLGQGFAAARDFEILEQLRKRSTDGRLMPVVILLNSVSRADRLSALRLGADDVFEPPYDLDIILARCERLRAIRQESEALKEQIESLHRLSVTDGLTQVFNHRYFQNRLKEEFRRAQRYEESLSLMLVDLDHFKSVNDLFGHQAGDLVLREVALAIKANIRDTDVVARYGGEEFAVLLPKTPLSGATTVAERVWAGVAGVRAGPERAHPVTLSIGVSAYPGDDVDTPEMLLQTADEALYTAKRAGRNRIVLHSATSATRRASGQI